MRKHCQSAIAFCLIILFSLLSCSYNSATGDNQFNWVSDDKEMKIGKSADIQIKQQHGIYRDPILSKYVNDIGQKMATHCGRTNIKYYFTVLDSPMINAFALPGGYVYVTRGVLAQMNSEAELAFVLGHEIGHVAAKHGAQRITQSEGINFALSLASLLLRDDPKGLGRVVNKVVELSVLGYGRQNEFESDKLGVDYLLRANYSVAAGSEFLKTLKKQEKYQSNWLSQLHSSHPPTDERIERVQDKLDSVDTSRNIELIVNKNQFLDKIDGIFMGAAPQSGQRKGSAYINYHYGFKLNVPNQWNMLATLKKPIVLLKYKDIATGSIIIEKTSEFRENKQTTEVLAGKTVLTHFYYRSPYKIIIKFKLNSQYNPENFEIPKIISSFKFLSNDELKDAKAYRLTIHTVKQNETLSSISKFYFNDAKHANEIAAFNNLTVNDSLKLNTKIKIPFY